MREVFEAFAGDGWAVTDWPKLQKEQRAKLDQKLDMLRSAEVDPITGKVTLPQELLAGPGVDGQKWIYKLKIRGNVALRPYLCLGPLDRAAEWTVLVRAIERDNVTTPSNAAAQAEVIRAAMVAGNWPRRPIPED